MSRSIRRHQQAVAKRRRIRIISECWGSRHGVKRPWRELSRAVMNEPGWWVHEFMTIPARRVEKRIEHAIVRGLDADAVSWPDNRKPHKYYW